MYRTDTRALIYWRSCITDVILEKVNSVYLRLNAPRHIVSEISDRFTFFAPDYKFHPKFKMGIWDGKIRLVNQRSNTVYAGLRKEILSYCEHVGYTVDHSTLPNETEFSLAEAHEFITSLKLDPKYEIRDYQLKTFVDCVRMNRALYVSPTASGKSMIIYFLARYYLKRNNKAKVLIVVPTTSLVEQFHDDMMDYGISNSFTINKVYSGHAVNHDCNLVITTWQTAVKQSPEWFEGFTVFFGDEAHKFNAKSLIDVAGKLTKTDYRFGFTGSLTGMKTDQLVLEGLFGPHKQHVSTADLIASGHVADVKIKCLALKYPESICKAMKKATYLEEKEYIVTNRPRTRFIKNLVAGLKGNVMILYQYVDKQGIPLFNEIRDENPGRNVHLIHGSVATDEREQVRKLVNQDTNSITVASMGCFSTGINIPNINYIIFASPSKSRILVMQMIGRGLRKSETKDSFVLYDIADDFSYKSHANYTIKHFAQRLKYYIEEKFNYKVYRVDLNE